MQHVIPRSIPSGYSKHKYLGSAVVGVTVCTLLINCMRGCCFDNRKMCLRVLIMVDHGSLSACL